MTFVYSNPQEFGSWTKENFDSACGALARAVPLYKTVSTLTPFIGYFVVSSTVPRCFIPEGLTVSRFVESDSEINESLEKEFQKFVRKIGISNDYKSVIYEASLNIVEISEEDTAIWVGFEKNFPDGFATREFKKFIQRGKAYFLDAKTGKVEKIEKEKERKQSGLFEEKKDIFEADWDYLVHCANCYHTMGGGIAKDIAILFPEALEADKATIKDESKIGTYSEAKAKNGGKIINLYGQSGIGNNGSPLERNARYDAIYNGLYLLFQEVSINDKGAEIAIPAGMACGLAGGSWKVVKAIIQDLQEMFGVRVVIYEKSI